VGGVLLDTAATLVGQNLSDISGAMYDPVSGQFVFLGTNSPTPVKNINLDYLYTALQAVYGSAVPPFVTLAPSAIVTSEYTQFIDMTVSSYGGGPSHTLVGTFSSPFLDSNPGNGFGGSGPSVILFPGDLGVATMTYAPFWPGVDTTVDVVLTGVDYGPALNLALPFCCKARFNCYADNDGDSWLGFSQWVVDAYDTPPPGNLSLTYSEGNLLLQNGGEFSDFICVNSAMAVPARQQRQFGGRVENTQTGWVMEEADRVMKCLALGTDNLTGAAYNSGTIPVPGYQNLFQLYGNTPPAGFFSRMWFTPQLMTLEQYVDPNTGLASVVFNNATVLCQTEAELTGGASPPQEQAFCANLTANYDAFAALKFPCYDPTGTRITQTNCEI
jgi:hypothetical protein